MGCDKVFLRNSAIDLLGHIVPLYDGVCMMVPSCEILVTKLHSVMILVVLHKTCHTVLCVTHLYFMFYVLIYFCNCYVSIIETVLH